MNLSTTEGLYNAIQSHFNRVAFMKSQDSHRIMTGTFRLG